MKINQKAIKIGEQLHRNENQRCANTNQWTIVEKITKDNYQEILNDTRMDAGIGFLYTFRNFGPTETIKPITIRLDMPLFLNRPPSGDEDFIQMRWIVGINRSF